MWHQQNDAFELAASFHSLEGQHCHDNLQVVNAANSCQSSLKSIQNKRVNWLCLCKQLRWSPWVHGHTDFGSNFNFYKCWCDLALTVKPSSSSVYSKLMKNIKNIPFSSAGDYFPCRNLSDSECSKCKSFHELAAGSIMIVLLQLVTQHNKTETWKFHKFLRHGCVLFFFSTKCFCPRRSLFTVWLW